MPLLPATTCPQEMQGASVLVCYCHCYCHLLLPAHGKCQVLQFTVGDIAREKYRLEVAAMEASPADEPLPLRLKAGRKRGEGSGGWVARACVHVGVPSGVHVHCVLGRARARACVRGGAAVLGLDCVTVRRRCTYLIISTVFGNPKAPKPSSPQTRNQEPETLKPQNKKQETLKPTKQKPETLKPPKQKQETLKPQNQKPETLKPQNQKPPSRGPARELQRGVGVLGKGRLTLLPLLPRTCPLPCSPCCQGPAPAHAAPAAPYPDLS